MEGVSGRTVGGLGSGGDARRADGRTDGWTDGRTAHISRILWRSGAPVGPTAVSYTHLTLPTICSV
eukprot:4618025-Prymnesium_polylepis.1